MNPLPGVPVVESPFYERLSAGWDATTRAVGDALRCDGGVIGAGLARFNIAAFE